jgi:hypothetical protein
MALISGKSKKNKFGKSQKSNPEENSNFGATLVSWHCVLVLNKLIIFFGQFNIFPIPCKINKKLKKYSMIPQLPRCSPPWVSNIQTMTTMAFRPIPPV